MIEVSGLTKRYGSIAALSNLSFTVPKGQIVGFLGANGAGKTTTMDILCGCIGADQGTAKISGYDITEAPLEAKRRLGYLPDVPPLHLDMEVADFIEYAARLHKLQGAQVKSSVNETIEKLSLGDVRHRLVGNLSKGYRQRVGLAQALVHDPEVLVLDEPTEGLDPNQIAQIRSLIRSLGQRHTIILSSHILSEVQNTCDYIIIINKGKIVTQGTYEELSRSMEAGNTYRLRVRQNGASLASSLKQIDGVAHVQSSGADDIEFALGKQAKDSVIDDVAKRVVEGGFGLKELTLKTRSLEEVFMQLTK